jgi:hypothetical protein
MDEDRELEELATRVANFVIEEPNPELTLQNLPDDILLDIIERTKLPEETIRELTQEIELSSDRRDFLNNLNEETLDQMNQQIQLLLDLGGDVTELEQQLEEAEEDFEDIELLRQHAQERVDEDIRNYERIVTQNINLMNWMRQVLQL